MWLIDKKYFDYRTARGHIFVHTQNMAESESTYLVSNETFAMFSSKVQAL